MPTVMLLVLAIATTIVICGSRIGSEYGWDLSTITLLLNSSTLLISMTVCLLQMVRRSSSAFDDICLRIHHIECLAWQTFSFDVEAFRRHYMRRVYITIVTLILPIVTKLYGQPLTTHRYVTVIGLIFLRAIVSTILLHAYFYIDLLDHMIQSFVRHINVRVSIETTPAIYTINFRSPATKQLIAEVFKLKLLHLNLWEISEKINRTFGWTIVVIFSQNFIYAVYNAFVIYTITMPQTIRFIKVLREYTNDQFAVDLTIDVDRTVCRCRSDQ